MSDYIARENRLVFTQQELDAFDAMLGASDRAGFYLISPITP
jgi:hypothetical protein